MTKSVFEQYEPQNWPFKFAGSLVVSTLAGGIPSSEKTAEGWLKSKLAVKDELIRSMVAEVMEDRQVEVEAAVSEVAEKLSLNGFKRDKDFLDTLYIEGRQLKAALKEAASVAANSGRVNAKGWGTPTDATYRKGWKAWFPEHVFVVEDKLHLLTENGTPVIEPTGISQRFVHSRYGSAIQYEEYVVDAHVDFTVETDHDFSEEQWASIWLAGERQGLGASRSQGFGRYVVTRWEPLKD